MYLNINKTVQTKGLISESFSNFVFLNKENININNKSLTKNNSYKKISTQNFINTLIQLGCQFNKPKDLLLFLINTIRMSI